MWKPGAGDKCSVSWEVRAGGCLGSGQSCSFSPAAPLPPQHSAQLGHKYEEQQKAAHRQLGILCGDPSRLISTLNDSLSTVSIQWHSIHHHYIYNRRYSMPPLTTGWCPGDGEKFSWSSSVLGKNWRGSPEPKMSSRKNIYEFTVYCCSLLFVVWHQRIVDIISATNSGWE